MGRLLKGSVLAIPAKFFQDIPVQVQDEEVESELEWELGASPNESKELAAWRKQIQKRKFLRS